MALVVYFQALKIDQYLAIGVTALFWLILNTKFIYKKSFELNGSNEELIETSYILGKAIKNRTIVLSEFKGVRNRVAWTYGKQCVTELVKRTGEVYKIRIEFIKYGVTDEAKRFLDDFLSATGMLELREIHA